MTATPARYLTPYVSQMLKEPDRTYDDCAAATGLMLGGDWTLGEILERPDGKERDVLTLRNIVRKRIGDTDGGLTLHDVNDILHELDPDLPDLWRYPGQKAKSGQSTAGATLRITWEQFRQYLQSGWSAALCGRTATGVGHVVHVTDGAKDGAVRRDPLTRNKPGWRGEKVPWSELRAFTERKDRNGDRYGSDDAIACALVKVGAETMAERARRAGEEARAKAVRQRDAAVAEARLATTTVAELRTALTAANETVRTLQARVDGYITERAALQARIKELETMPVPDCVVAVNAERGRVLDLLSDGIDELVASIR